MPFGSSHRGGETGSNRSERTDNSGLDNSKNETKESRGLPETSDVTGVNEQTRVNEVEATTLSNGELPNACTDLTLNLFRSCMLCVWI